MWFLLIDGKMFHAKAVEHDYPGFYRDRMKSLATMVVELPRTYESFRKFIDRNVFGEGEEEVVHPSVETQRGFLRKFYADVEEEKAHQKGDPHSAIDGAPNLLVNGPTFTVDPNPQPAGLLHPQIMAGCMWDSNNWSCAYDTVFMCFWSIYKKFPPSWRNNWRLNAPKLGGFFGEAFDSLLALARNEQISQVALYQEFDVELGDV